ncbi:uncharacterized protein involved in outer membrane biogenesis [Extensimonas vulgaris]|uniref:Uncharacterized protein involved in outer membrane biogenesis n=2 Tax=Extensimonas vulgaris TaxID=1031594 RepID=A0A369AS83_9BURK|nr:DUF748 domain-containing protein [Extensimonas vulgaris]RCX11077.1 uncharacterized protein involved in outer membrane biogenesis [Extensimonas vulgaris]TWI41750.1 uncharacterized protein involved in outer membrane biogenesis [Extensimonas vulgaris]
MPALSSAWRRYRWLRAAAWALLALGLWWLLGWLVLPSLLHRTLERFASAQLGRQVTVGAIAFKPWSLELTLRDLDVAGARSAPGAIDAPGAPATPPQLHIASIYVDAELQSLLRLGPVVDALRIDAPVLRLTHQGQGHYDVDDIIAKFSAPSEKPPASAGPLRMALHNLELTHGSIDFADLPAGTTHRVRVLHLGLPFLSTLPAQRLTYVTPQLSFTVNGSPFDLQAQAQPFTPERAGKAALHWKRVDLAPYLPYLPASLPVRLQGAVLDVDLQLNFAQAPRPSVQLSGQVLAHQLRLADRQAQPLLALEQLRVDLTDVRPLERVVKLALVELTAPQVYAARAANGTLNWAQLGAQPAQAATNSDNKASAPKAPETAAANEPGKGAAAHGAAVATAKSAAQGAGVPSAPASTPAATPAAPADAGWNVEVARAAVQGGRVQWRDASTRPAAALEAHNISLEATGFALPWRKPMPLHGALELPAQGTLAFEGEASANSAKLQVKAKDVALQLAAPYLAQLLEPTLTGQLSGTLGLQWQAPGTDAANAAHPGLRLSAQPLVLQKLALRQGKDTLASVGKVELQNAVADLAQRQITLQRLAIAEPQLAVARDAQGHWMFERWLRGGVQMAGADAQPPAKAADQAAKKAAGKAKSAQTTPAAVPWRVQLGELALSGGAVDYSDEASSATVRPVALRLSALQIQARELSAEARKPIALQLSAQVAARRGKPGQLRYQGSLTPTPLALQGRITAQKLPLQALDGYLGEFLAIRLRHAELGFLGQLALAQTPQGPKLLLHGDMALDALRADSTAASTAKTAPQVGQELLAWQDLSLRGLRLALAPQQPLRLDVRETSLSDFYGRIALNEEGRLNLADIVKRTGKDAGGAAAAGAPGGARAAPPDATPAPAAGQTVAQATPQAPAPTTPPAPARDPLAPVIHFGPMSLVNGTVQFSDFFIHPNYSADLSQLTGKLSAFSSEAPNGVPELADLELRGRVEGSATLEVTGKLNPLVRPLVLDIQGKARDLDLPPLSPYAIKYAGHGIESGKLNMDVAYKVQPDGQLTASNKLVLHQLTFGEPVEGAPTSLPVRLATALLADSNGVINLDLPISGSLNDPQFRLGPVILKIIGNIITRAVTAPFRLLAHAFGGGTEDLGQVVFAPGSPELTAAARQQLDKVVQMLTAKPALQVSVTGMVNLVQEREGLQRERLRQLVLAEKRRAGRASAASEPATPGSAGAAAKAPAPTAQDLATDEEPTLSADEYASLLRRVYRRADFPKPRNLLGLTKDLPVPEMEALLLAHLPASEDLAREVATHRAQAVVRYLSAHQLPAQRLFVNAPKVRTTPEEGWVPRAELGLAMR